MHWKATQSPTDFSLALHEPLDAINQNKMDLKRIYSLSNDNRMYLAMNSSTKQWLRSLFLDCLLFMVFIASRSLLEREQFIRRAKYAAEKQPPKKIRWTYSLLLLLRVVLLTLLLTGVSVFGGKQQAGEGRRAAV